jgi:hypothetical protein
MAPTCLTSWLSVLFRASRALLRGALLFQACVKSAGQDDRLRLPRTDLRRALLVIPAGARVAVISHVNFNRMAGFFVMLGR